MIEIATSRQAKKVAGLDFCYVCGKPFTESYPSTRDHVPPKSAFMPEDRDWPLILPAHEECNTEYSFRDEQAKGLIALLHKPEKAIPPLKTELAGVVERDGQLTGVLLEGLRLRSIVAKILRACHAALYGEFLKEEDTSKAILLPLPAFDPETGNAHEYEFLSQHEVFCKMLKDNRRVGNVDTIEAFNGKFRFQVVWAVSDDGHYHFGVFAIDLYEWHNLASHVLGQPQGCCGVYRLGRSPAPGNASVATSIELPFKYNEPRNPFEGT